MELIEVIADRYLSHIKQAVQAGGYGPDVMRRALINAMKEYKDEYDASPLKWKQQMFTSFWAKYPNKSGKAPAYKKWLNLKKGEIDKIMNTIDAFIAYKPFESYSHPMASTYINQRRWEDELPTMKQPSSYPQTVNTWSYDKLERK